MRKLSVWVCWVSAHEHIHVCLCGNSASDGLLKQKELHWCKHALSLTQDKVLHKRTSLESPQRAADHAHNMQGHIILYLFPQLFAMVMQQKHQQLSSVWVELLLSTRVLANVLMFYSLFTKSFSASILKKERNTMSIYVASHLSCDFYKTLFLLQIPGPLSILKNSSKIISKYGGKTQSEFILLLMGEK